MTRETYLSTMRAVSFTISPLGNSLNGSHEEEEGETDHHEGGYPGDRIEERAIRMLCHQLLVVDEKEHEDEYERKDHSVDDLREVHDPD
jgi:hypothetical protein